MYTGYKNNKEFLIEIQNLISRQPMKLPEDASEDHDSVWISYIKPDMPPENCKDLEFKLTLTWQQHYHLRRYLHLNYEATVLLYKNIIDNIDSYPTDKQTSTDKVKLKYRVLPRRDIIEFLTGEEENLAFEINPTYENVDETRFPNIHQLNGKWDNVNHHPTILALTGNFTVSLSEVAKEIDKRSHVSSTEIVHLADKLVLGDNPDHHRLKTFQHWNDQTECITEEDLVKLLEPTSNATSIEELIQGK